MKRYQSDLIKCTLVFNLMNFDPVRLLSKNEKEAGETLEKIFEDEGIKIVKGRLERVRPGSEGANSHVCICSTATSDFVEITGDVLLLALGRKPATKGMDLEDLGARFKANGGFAVRSKLTIAGAKGIFAAGDCTGDKQL